MSRPRILLLFVAWVFVAAFLGVVAAIVGTELLRLAGVVESGEESYQRSINVIWLIVFVSAVAVPFVFRKRFVEQQRTDDP